MDIQKKREAFEKLSEIAEILKNKTIKFVEKTNKYYSYHYSVEYLNGAWMAWQAKAQAVPEGFVVVPKEPTDEMWSSGIDAYTDAMEDNKALPAASINDIYKAMIEAAQEQTND